MWERGVCIYGTLGVPNNFPTPTPTLHTCTDSLFFFNWNNEKRVGSIKIQTVVTREKHL